MKNILLITSPHQHYIHLAEAIQSILDPDAYNVEICYTLNEGMAQRLHYAFAQCSMHVPFAHALYQDLRQRYAHDMYERNVFLFERFVPDMVIALDPVSYPLAELVGKHANIPSVSFFPFLQGFGRYERTGATQYYATAAEWIAAKLKSSLKGQEVSVLTYPIHKSFLELSDKSPDEIFRQLHLKEQYTVVLSPRTLGDIKAIHTILPKDVNLVIYIEGRKKFQQRVLRKLFHDKYSNVSLYWDEVPRSELFLIANVHIMSADPSSVMETLAAGTIPYIFHANKGEQQQLATLLQTKGLGTYGKLSHIGKQCVLQEGALTAFRQNATAFLETLHIYTEEQLFNKYCKGILPEVQERPLASFSE